MKRYLYLWLVCTIVITGCKQKIKEPEMNEDVTDSAALYNETTESEAPTLEVELMNEDGVGIGTATLFEEEEGVKIAIDAHHIKPGIHGFHIHERGVCEAPTFESAGGHFNPTNKKHGFDHPEGPHAGDMENIEVEEDGTVNATITNEMVTLRQGEVNSLVQSEGTSLLIHEQADDYTSQPAGDAGERIICGVIAAPEKEPNKS